jgi:hypothetical protein
VDAEAAVVVVSHVLADGSWVVRLDVRPIELRRVRAGHSQPELFGRCRIGRLMDVDAEDQPFGPDSCYSEESEEQQEA